MDEVRKLQGFSRRRFVQGAAVLAATGMLAGCSPGSPGTPGQGGGGGGSASETTIYSGACRGNCASGCFLNIHVRDNQVVRTSARDFPNTDYNRICSRGLTHMGRMYGAHRLLYPMKRVGERGSNDFERIGWDEALDTIAEKWQGYIDEYGAQSIMFFMGSGNYALLSGSCNWAGPYQRFINVLGLSYCSLNVDAAMGFGSSRATGGIDLANELTDRKNAKTQIFWGNNPAVSMPQTMHWFLRAKEQGTRLIVIDPVYNVNASKADWWLPVKGGTDGALALGVLNVLLEEGWVTEDDLRTRTNADLLIKEDAKFLRMSDLGVEPTEEVNPATGEPTTVDPLVVWDSDADKAVAFGEAATTALKDVKDIDGIKVQTVYENALDHISQYPPATAAKVCGLTEADIRELARVYHEDGPVTTEIMMGCNHYINGHYTSWPLYLVGLLTGNVGKPGAAMGTSQEYLPMIFYSNVAAAHYPTAADGTPVPGQAAYLHTMLMEGVLDSGTYLGEELILKSMYVHCSNPIVTMCDHEYTKRWFDKFEFVVVADVCMTETCKHADIVLPSAYWFEQIDIAYLFSTHPYLLWQDKAVEPLGESRPDYDIFGQILGKLGLGEFWLTDEEYIDTILDSDYWRSVGVTPENLKANKLARIYPEGDKIASTEAFATETGRIGLYIDTVVPAYVSGNPIDESIEHGLHWETPKYAGEDREHRATYPYHFLSEHMRTHTHSQWWDCEYVKEYEAEPIVKVNPDDAAELGIAEGDILKMSNAQGSVTMKCALNAGLPRKMISSSRSWQLDDFIDGHFASLPPKEFNQVCANQAFNDVAVKIEKV